MTESNFLPQLRALNKKVAALAKEKPFIRHSLLKARSRILVSSVTAELLDREGLSVRRISQELGVPEKRFREWLTGAASFEPTIGFLVDLSSACSRTFEIELVPFPTERSPSRNAGENEPVQLEPIALITAIRRKFHLYHREKDDVGKSISSANLAAKNVFEHSSRATSLWELSDVAEKNELFLRLKFLPLQARTHMAQRISRSHQNGLQTATGFFLDEFKTT